MPVQQLLELLSNIPGLGGLAQSGADAIQSIRANLGLDEEKESKEKTSENYQDALYVDNTKDKAAEGYDGMPFGKTPGKTKAKTTETKVTTEGKGSGGKSIQVTIQNLVKELTISTSNIKESPAKLKQMIAEALTGAVRDFETTI